MASMRTLVRSSTDLPTPTKARTHDLAATGLEPPTPTAGGPIGCTDYGAPHELPVSVGPGRLVLMHEGLLLEGGGWALPLSQLRSVSAGQWDRLYPFSHDPCFEPKLSQESLVKWERVTDTWRRRALAETSP
jgi:hypothetical protein